jgi:hypothetical protein
MSGWLAAAAQTLGTILIRASRPDGVAASGVLRLLRADVAGGSEECLQRSVRLPQEGGSASREMSSGISTPDW